MAHAQTGEELGQVLETDLSQGLSDAEAEARLGRFGENALSKKQKETVWDLIWEQIHQPLVYILIVAGVVTVFLKEYIDASVIFAVVVVNVIIGFVQEYKAMNTLESLSKSMATFTTVIRAGKKHRVDSKHITLGDLIFLQQGDKVPADIRLISTKELQTKEATLTGESLPVDKTTEPLPEDCVLADRRNMVYASTYITSGQATGIVTAIGDQTEVGRISELIQEVERVETPLAKKIGQITKLLLVLILGLAGVTFTVGLLQGQSWKEMFMVAVALSVAAIPEGLPAAVTAMLAIGVNRMARRNAIIRKLPVVETLGSATIICSDKTGTLTEGLMTVREIAVHGLELEVTGSAYDPNGEFLHQGESFSPKDHQGLWMNLHAGLLCNDSSLEKKGGIQVVQGNPTEGALLVTALKAGLSMDEITALYPRIDSIPFDSKKKYMVSLHHGENGSKTLFVKGAAEHILALCDRCLLADGSHHPLEIQRWQEKIDAMAQKGLRILAMAHFEIGERDFSLDHNTLPRLTFSGLQGIIDPPRKEAVSAINSCHEAGIRVKMITGDHAITAKAIAMEMGILTDHNEQVIEGKEIDGLSEEALTEISEHTHVFARVTPEQKLRIVRALQSRSEIVAMTGDGVNDAPALKQADIGTAMGITGTEVSKEASDMVLADDNFSSIKAAVEEGRGVYDNLTKFIVWTLPTNVGEGLVIMLAIIMGLSLPILPIQILWVNMSTALLYGLMLAFEPKEPSIMQRPPRKPDKPFFAPNFYVKMGIVSGMLVLSAYNLFNWELEAGRTVEQARTVAVTVFVLIEGAYVFNCRSFKHSLWEIGFFSNKLLLFGWLLMLVCQLAFVYVPFMNIAFQSASIPLASWGRILASAFLTYLLVEIEKWVERRLF